MANEIDTEVPAKTMDLVDPLTTTPPPIKPMEPLAATTANAAPLNQAEVQMIAAMQAALQAPELAQPVGSQPHHDVQASSPLPRSVPWPVYVALCLFVGTVGGVTMKAVISPAKVKQEDSHAKNDHAKDAHSEKHEPHDSHGSPYAEIDSALGSGKYEHAYEDIEKHKAKHPEQWDAAGTYREALSLEGMKRYKAASKLYAQAANPDGDPAKWAVAALGQVRCAIAQGDSVFANKLLSRIALQSGRPGMPAALNGECLFLRAHCELLDLGVEAEVDPFNPNAISWPSLSTKLEHVLDAFPYGAAHKHDEHEEHDDSAQHTADEGDHVPQPKVIAKADEQLVSWNRTSGSILSHVQGLAEQFHWELKIGAKETSELATRSSPVQVAGLPVGEVLSALLHPMGLEWKQAGTQLVIRKPTSEPSWAEASATLQRALAVAPKHLAAPSARICIANCDLEMGRTRSAITSYQKFLETEPAATAARDASYNLGLHHAQQGEWKFAKQQFLDVIDRSKGGRWQELGRWWLGRVALDSGDIGLSLKFFRMLFESSSKDLRAGAVLGVAACHLFNDDVEAAQEVLLKLRAPAGTIQNIGTVFKTWVQQKLKPSAGRAERVYDSLKVANDLRGLGTIGLYLAGKMYREMDDRTRMADVFAFATLRCRGPIAVRMHFELAEFWNEFDNRDEARQHYLATAILDPEGWGRHALVGLAGLALREGEPRECLALCKQYLQVREARASDVLSLMGRSYEQLGKYRAAAECFAGKFPAE